MSTRCTINFTEGGRVIAKIYRHSDGYPDTEHGVLADIAKFFADVEAQTSDTRFGDASYLAAKFVVWQAGQYARPGKPLDFLSLGILGKDPGDIEYTYAVECEKREASGRPKVSHRSVR
jgi:hypothetical protein